MSRSINEPVRGQAYRNLGVGWPTDILAKISRTLTLWIKFTSHSCQIGLESDSTANALCELHSWQRYIFWQLTRLLQMFFRGFFLECMVMIENNKFQELSQSSHSNRPITSPLLIYTKSMKSCQIWATTACFLRYGFKKKGGEKRIPDSVKEVKYFVYQPCIASCSLRFACWNIAASPLSTKPCVILSLRITVYRRILFFWRRTISKSYYFVLIRVS